MTDRTAAPRTFEGILQRRAAHESANPRRYESFPRDEARQRYEDLEVPQLIERVVSTNPQLSGPSDSRFADWTTHITPWDSQPEEVQKHALQTVLNAGYTPDDLYRNLAAVIDTGVRRAAAIHPEALNPGILEYLAVDVPKLTRGTRDVPTVQSQRFRLANDYGLDPDLAAVLHSLNSAKTAISQFSPGKDGNPTAAISRLWLPNDIAARRSAEAMTAMDPALLERIASAPVGHPHDEDQVVPLIYQQVKRAAQTAQDIEAGVPAPLAGYPTPSGIEAAHGPKMFDYSSFLIDPLGQQETNPSARVVLDSIVPRAFFPIQSAAEIAHLIDRPGVKPLLAHIAALVAKDRGLPDSAISGIAWFEGRTPATQVGLTRGYQSQVSPKTVEKRLPSVLLASAFVTALAGYGLATFIRL